MKRRIAAFAYLILRDNEGAVEILAVKRSPNDRYFPNLWGLPAGTLRKREDYADAIRRTAMHRLGIEVDVLGELAAGSSDRGSHVVEMRLFEARIIAGSPRVTGADPAGHGYTEANWAEPGILEHARESGSLCCRLAETALPLGRKGLTPSLR
jgi:ADP-ribose pyrophosphatase YjhB (NUDIX family)